MEEKVFNELVSPAEEDVRFAIDGFVFYIDDGPMFPDEETGAQALPAIMAIGLAHSNYMLELAQRVRNGQTAFSKNRLNPRIAPFYQRNLLTYPEGFEAYLDDVTLEDLNDEEQRVESPAPVDEEAQQVGAIEERDQERGEA